MVGLGGTITIGGVAWRSNARCFSDGSRVLGQLFVRKYRSRVSPSSSYYTSVNGRHLRFNGGSFEILQPKDAKNMLSSSQTIGCGYFSAGSVRAVSTKGDHGGKEVNVDNESRISRLKCTVDMNGVDENLKKPTAVSRKGILGNYSVLFKSRLSALVVFSASAGYVAAGPVADPSCFVGTLVGTGLCAGAAGAFNQVLERYRDSKMHRTAGRPLVTGQISPNAAIKAGIAATALGGSTLFFITNPLTAALGVGNVLLYSIPYTLSKPLTEANTWIGAVVGSIPPVMGWTAATGGVVGVEPVILASILYFWQLPHFIALSYMYRKDYARGGFKMVPCADPTGSRTSKIILSYSAYMMALPVAAATLGATSWMFPVEGFLINGAFLRHALTFRKNPNNGNARKVFLSSLWHLPLLLVLFCFHSRAWEKDLSKVRILFYFLIVSLCTLGLDCSVFEMVINQPLSIFLCVYVAPFRISLLHLLQVRNKLHSMCVHDVVLHEKEIFCPHVGGVRAIDEVGKVGATTVTRQGAIERQ